jgi:tetratricopeptide (TPR) repeat protein
MRICSLLVAAVIPTLLAACHRNETDSIRLADKLAAHPDDPSKPAAIAGVPDAKLQSGEAIEAAAEACIEAIKADPNEARYEFELGRVLLLGGMVDDAREHLEAAAQRGHAAAYFYLGSLELQVTKGLFQKASNANFKPANKLVEDLKEVDPFHAAPINWQLWFYLALGLIAAAAIAYWLLRKRRRPPPAGTVAATPAPTP